MEKIRKTKKKSLSASEYIELLNSFSRTQRLEIVRKINLMTFKQEWHQLSKQMPDTEIPDAEIMREVKAVRYGKS